MLHGPCEERLQRDRIYFRKYFMELFGIWYRQVLHANRLSNLCRMKILNYTNENVLQIDTPAPLNEFVIANGWAMVNRGMRACITIFRCDIWSVRLWANSILFGDTHTLSPDRRFSRTKTGSEADHQTKCPVGAHVSVRVCVSLQINNLLNCHAVLNEYMP